MEDDLHQADLSNLTIRQMTPAQRAEMRRRFEVFIRDFTGRTREDAVAPKPQLRKWVPGMKA